MPNLEAIQILSAILNKYYSFSDPFGLDWVFWYIRESSTALISSNLAHTWTLLRRLLNLRAFDGKSSNQRSGTRSGFRSNISRTHGSAVRDVEPSLDRSGSQERINKDYGIPLKIYQQQEVEVHTYPITPTDQHLSSGNGLTTTKVVSQRGSRDDETSSEMSMGGIVKVVHGI